MKSKSTSTCPPKRVQRKCKCGHKNTKWLGLTTKKQYLVYCQYDYYCQGIESNWGYFLVTALNWEDACSKLRATIENARDFQNKTIE